MSRYLLDSSFVIDLLNEIADGDTQGAALAWLKRNRRAQLWVSPVTLAEVLEGAENVEAVGAYLGRFGWQGIHRAQAQTAARRQRGAQVRLGENDAWQAAVAECMKARILGHDAAFQRLGPAYEDYRPL
ncbi:MAG TPA: PIN domain-containing protein [Steroidobacteraceae bacterium]|nr:PIN domain-containing protein [Steroidobacteraceae bacterium]